MLRTGLRKLLADRPGLAVVGEAGNGHELLAQLPTTPADVVLLDQNMPGVDGAETARQLREHYPAVRVLETYQLEPELQNEGLLVARVLAEQARQEYADLHEHAPADRRRAANKTEVYICFTHSLYRNRNSVRIPRHNP